MVAPNQIHLHLTLPTLTDVQLREILQVFQPIEVTMPTPDGEDVLFRGKLFRDSTGRAPPPKDAEEERVWPFGSGPKPQHTDDWSAIYEPGIGTFFFRGPCQRAVVRELWEARAAGHPFVRQQALLRASGSQATRLCDVFRSGGVYHNSWGKLIVQAAPGGGAYSFPNAASEKKPPQVEDW